VIEEEPEEDEGLGLLGEEETEPEVITARHEEDEENEED
jgi:hypothetical protein